MLRNNRGATLPLIIVIFAVIMLLGSVMILLQNSEGRASIRHKNQTKAYYLARSAVNAVVADIKKNNNLSDNPFLNEIVIMVSNKDQDKTITASNFDAGSEDYGQFDSVEVDITWHDEHQVMVKGKARVNGVSETSGVVLNNGAMFYAIHADESMDIGSMTTILGNEVAISDLESGNIFIDEFNTGTDKVEVEYDGFVEESFKYKEIVPTDSTDPIDPTDTTVWMRYDQEFNSEFDASGDSHELYSTILEGVWESQDTAIVLVSGEPKNKNEKIVFDDGIIWEPEVEGGLDAHPDKNLILFIEDNLNVVLQTPPNENNTVVLKNPQQLLIILGENATLSIQANSAFYGYIYGPSANVEFLSGASNNQDVLFTGAIIAKTFDSNEASLSMQYEAPESGGFIEGSIGKPNENIFILEYWVR